MMLTNDQRATPHAEVICTELKNGEAVLLHLGTHTYFTLNQTGSLIWSFLEKKQSVAEIARTLEAKFEISLEQAQQSVLALLEELRSEKLITWADKQGVA